MKMLVEKYFNDDCFELNGSGEVKSFFLEIDRMLLGFSPQQQLIENLIILFRKDDLSVLESGECQSLIQVCFCFHKKS